MKGYKQMPLGTVKMVVREDGSAVLELRDDGAVLWEGRKITEDQELVEALCDVVAGRIRVYKPRILRRFKNSLMRGARRLAWF